MIIEKLTVVEDGNAIEIELRCDKCNKRDGATLTVSSGSSFGTSTHWCDECASTIEDLRKEGSATMLGCTDVTGAIAERDAALVQIERLLGSPLPKAFQATLLSERRARREEKRLLRIFKFLDGNTVGEVGIQLLVKEGLQCGDRDDRRRRLALAGVTVSDLDDG